MIATETLKNIVLVLFGLTIVWIIKIIVRKEFETLFRALLVSVLFGVTLLFLNQTKLETISWKAVREELFPSKTVPYTFVKDEGIQNGYKYSGSFSRLPGRKARIPGRPRSSTSAWTRTERIITSPTSSRSTGFSGTSASPRSNRGSGNWLRSRAA